MNTDAQELKGHLDLLLLAALSGGPLHGYGLIEELKQRSGGTFELPEGTVYPALHRLERQGLLSSAWDEDGKRRRRVYSLTRSGRRELARRRERWEEFSRVVSLVAAR
jgi:PadR family transcriptional regulator